MHAFLSKLLLILSRKTKDCVSKHLLMKSHKFDFPSAWAYISICPEDRLSRHIAFVYYESVEDANVAIKLLMVFFDLDSKNISPY